MTTTTAPPATVGSPQGPPFSVAGAFLEGLAAQDFPLLAATLDDQVRMTALTPNGVRQWDGPDQVRAVFRGWFGTVEQFELVEATVGEVASRLQLRWRARVRTPERGAGWFLVEQQVYADTGPDGRIVRLSMLCSGFRPEGLEGALS